MIVGSNATFTVTAGGIGPFFYQWFFNGAPILNANTNVFSITNAQLTNSGNYLVVVSNNFNAVTSAPVVLTVTNFINSPPLILSSPTNRQDVVVGTSVTISVTATSAVPIFYQWYFEDSQTLNTFVLSGATNNVLAIPNAKVTNSGLYQVVITNVMGAVTSSVSKLVVTNAPGDINPGDINPGAYLRIKGAPAPTIQMTSSPDSGRNFSTMAGADFDGSMEEPLRGRASRRGGMRAGGESFLRSNPWPPSRREIALVSG